MSWDLSFISEENFKKHVRSTIDKYRDKGKSYGLQEFNNNIVDPIKLTFDKTVSGSSWKETISNEIFRQRDKSINNAIGYFHQYMFKYIDRCSVPQNGKEGGWDVIYSDPEGIVLPDGNKVHKVYVEMKNKHNTMNSSSAAKTYLKMRTQIADDDDCACFLVEVISKQSQNTEWEIKVEGQKRSHKLIRRLSIDKFYEMVTGDKLAFYKICKLLPGVIEQLVNDEKHSAVPVDLVYDELVIEAGDSDSKTREDALARAIYLLGFSSYSGFEDE